MKIYVAYQLAGHSLKKQTATLKGIAQILDELGYQSFIFLRDIQNWDPSKTSPKEVIENAVPNLKSCDVLLALMETPKKSEGMLLESGYMKGLGKKVIVASKPHDKGVLLKAISDSSFEYENLNDFKKSLKKSLNNLS